MNVGDYNFLGRAPKNPLIFSKIGPIINYGPPKYDFFYLWILILKLIFLLEN
jgi:hypothetical protein